MILGLYFELYCSGIRVYSRFKNTKCAFWFVSSKFKIVQILVHSHFELVSSLLALDEIEPVPQPLTQMAVEMINIHLILVHQKR